MNGSDEAVLTAFRAARSDAASLPLVQSGEMPGIAAGCWLDGSNDHCSIKRRPPTSTTTIACTGDDQRGRLLLPLIVVVVLSLRHITAYNSRRKAIRHRRVVIVVVDIHCGRPASCSSSSRRGRKRGRSRSIDGRHDLVSDGHRHRRLLALSTLIRRALLLPLALL